MLNCLEILFKKSSECFQIKTLFQKTHVLFDERHLYRDTVLAFFKSILAQKEFLSKVSYTGKRCFEGTKYLLKCKNSFITADVSLQLVIYK